ncbi:MAG: AAA family ATPase [Hyphomicrobiaceae bacterium]
MTGNVLSAALSADAGQSAAVEFLKGEGVVDAGRPRHIETHIAHVFVGRDRALKIKRAVLLPYLDFSTLEKRRAMCLRELEVNQPQAPDLYLGVVPIVARDDGQLSIGGRGTPVEWAVEMRAFAQSDLLSARAAAGTLNTPLLKAAADEVLAMHRRAQTAIGANPVRQMRSIVTDVGDAIDAAPIASLSAATAFWREAAWSSITRHESLLMRRAAEGHVRRCHGDLHLANIVVWRGRPVPFDAIEFSEDIATVDTLYDLAFLLMDTFHRAGRESANVILNRYLWASGDIATLQALALLPLYLSARAAIRAMVAAERAMLDTRGGNANTQDIATAKTYLDDAVNYLQPGKPRLVAIGGLSGTGKSTLAATLAPRLHATAGAVHLRSDLERKFLAGVAETERLPASSYTRKESARTYARMFTRAEAVIAAGHSVILDAVFSTSQEREAAEDIARRHGVPFDGIWLEAGTAILADRVTRREGDASDATRAVVEAQIARGVGHIEWPTISAGGSAEQTLRLAEHALTPL